MLQHHQGCSTPFTAETYALDQSQRYQQNWSPDPDLVVGRQKSDGERAQGHHQHREHERSLSADSIAKVSEQYAANRSCKKPHRIGSKRRKRTRQRVKLRKKQVVEHEGGGGAVNQKVVPFDHRSDRTGKYHRRHRRLLQPATFRCGVLRCAHMTLLCAENPLCFGSSLAWIFSNKAPRAPNVI